MIIRYCYVIINFLKEEKKMKNTKTEMMIQNNTEKKTLILMDKLDIWNINIFILFVRSYCSIICMYICKKISSKKKKKKKKSI